MQKVTLFFENGTPLKPFPLPKTNGVCKKCGAAVRWAKDKTVGVRMALDEDVYIIRPAEGFGIGCRKFLTRSGDIIAGEPVLRGSKGCRVGYRVHKCEDSGKECRAEVRIEESKGRK